jgi:hypothetical protein
MAQDLPGDVLKAIAPLPAQPGEDAWKFVADLKAPLWSRHAWSAREATAGEADLRGGVRVDAQFTDRDGLLKTAYGDLSDFLVAGKVPQNGPFVIETKWVETSTFEAYRIEVTSEHCRILAADTEGIRRGCPSCELHLASSVILESWGRRFPGGQTWTASDDGARRRRDGFGSWQLTYGRAVA